jgi:acetoin utilization protein AcuB
MSHPVITIHPELPIQEALFRMRQENVRRFPVVDKRGKLVGIVSEKDLLDASPSDATSLSIFELNYLLNRVSVEEIMTRNVITIDEDTPIEDAARIMANNKIGGLPVMRNSEVVGIITETDLFKVLLELMGAHESGIRLTVMAPNVPGELAKLTKAIYDIGGNIVSLGTFLGDSPENREVCLVLDGAEPSALREAVKPFVKQIIDICEQDVVND